MELKKSFFQYRRLTKNIQSILDGKLYISFIIYKQKFNISN